MNFWKDKSAVDFAQGKYAQKKFESNFRLMF